MILTYLQKKVFTLTKAGDAVSVSTLRYLISALKNREIQLRDEGMALGKDDVLKVLRKQIKQHKESVAIYESAGRADLVAKESGELRVLEDLLPEIESLDVA